ncbi:hypothetical protein, partial [Chryseobacterium sp. 5_R23647]|uniref:hypothetical protein n=1 Tax=Chryseobacterium sp. 5_R23647 TaxID=2258964 RepID=UPI001E34A09A
SLQNHFSPDYFFKSFIGLKKLPAPKIIFPLHAFSNFVRKALHFKTILIFILLLVETFSILLYKQLLIEQIFSI